MSGRKCLRCKRLRPRPEACHAAVTATVDSRNYRPVDCAQKHLVQTLHVGQLTGEVAVLAAPPKLSDPAAEPVYAECDRGVKARLGRDWRDFRFNVVVHLPTAAAWTAGARWVRCDVVIPRDLARMDDSDLIEQEGPLEGPVLQTLALGCFVYKQRARREPDRRRVHQAAQRRIRRHRLHAGRHQVPGG